VKARGGTRRVLKSPQHLQQFGLGVERPDTPRDTDRGRRVEEVRRDELGTVRPISSGPVDPASATPRRRSGAISTDTVGARSVRSSPTPEAAKIDAAERRDALAFCRRRFGGVVEDPDRGADHTDQGR
jgi:hypothetical protein